MASSPNDPWEAKPQWPWIVGSAVVIAGLAIALSLFLSRTHKVETVYVTASAAPSISLPVVPSSGASASPSESGGTGGGPGGDAATQQTLEEAATSAKTIESTTGSMTRANSLGLAPSFPSLTFKQPFDPSTGPNELSLATTPTTWAAAAMSNSGACWWIKVDGSTATTTYGSGEPCTGQAAAGATGTQWPAAQISPTP